MRVQYDILLKKLVYHGHDVEDITGLETRLTNLEDRYEYYEIFQSTSSGSGQVSVPTGATIILDFYPEGVDALAVKLDTQGRPLDESPVTSGGAIVTTTIDINGNYVLSGTPSAYPIGIVYFVKIMAKDSGNILETQIIQNYAIDNEHIANKVTSLSSSSTDIQYPSAKTTYTAIEDTKAFAVAMAAAL